MREIERSASGDEPDPAEPDPTVADEPSQAGHAKGLWVLLGILVVVVGGGGAYAWSVVRPTVSSKYEKVSYIVPAAPRLTAGTGEVVYRIDPTKSKASYGVDERIIGATAHHATGSTSGIAGDIAVNAKDPSASRLGKIVIDLEELHSDNHLRDARIRKDFLSSHADPMATFQAGKITGLPATLTEGKWYSFILNGNLTVKGKAAPVRWASRAQFDKGRLSMTATTQVKMSTFGIGPISIAGLVKTSDEVDLSLELSALDPSTFTVPNVIAAPTVQKHSGGPKFSTAIEPILQSSCASCHNPGEVGTAHWQLQTAGDAAAIADGIGVITRAKYMPPWPASSKGVPLAHSTALPQKDIDLLSQWAADGGQLDVPESTPIIPSKAAAALQPRRDVVMKMPQAYTGSLSVPNDYRCFVLDPHITKPTFVTGFTFSPDQVEEIHHAQVFHITADQVTAAKAIKSTDGQPGWTCYGGLSIPAGGGGGGRQFDRAAYEKMTPAQRQAAIAQYRKDRKRSSSSLLSDSLQPGLIAGWAPGQNPVKYPDESGILMQPGDAMVLQVHYHYDRQPTPDRSTLSLETAPTTTGLKQVEIINPLAPVEIPCNPGVKAPLCDRDAALQDDAREYGPQGSAIENGLLFLCHESASQIGQQFAKTGIASSSCTYNVPRDGTIIGVMGHMHTIGKSISVTLDQGMPQQKTLLDIPTWNFDWQMNYQLATPLHVTAKDTITLSCTWDRSLDPNRPAKYIVFAEGTEDEMCFSTYALIPDVQPPISPPKSSSGG